MADETSHRAPTRNIPTRSLKDHWWGWNTIVIHDAAGSVTDTDVQPRWPGCWPRSPRLLPVGSVRSPYTAGASQISTDKHPAYATVTFTKGPHNLSAAGSRTWQRAGSLWWCPRPW